MGRRLDYAKQQKRVAAIRRGSENVFSDFTNISLPLQPAVQSIASSGKRRQSDISGLSIRINRLEKLIKKHGKDWPEANLRDAEGELDGYRVQLEKLEKISQSVDRMGALNKIASGKQRKAISQFPVPQANRHTAFEEAVSIFLSNCADASINGKPLPRPPQIISKRFPGAKFQKWIKMILSGKMYGTALKHARARAGRK